MELRARTRTLPRRAATTAAALVVLLASAFAGAVASPADAKTSKPPVVKKISPMTVSVGQTLTMRGRGFVRGRKKTTVVFKRDGARAVFVRADLSTAKLLKVTVPDTLSKYFRKSGGQPVATRFRVRVLGKRLGRSYTSVKRSPFIGPVPQQGAPDGDCDGDGRKNGVDGDDDNDLLSDTFETQIHTDPCRLDTDGDEVEDGYEYESALNLNDDEFQEPNTDLFYPGKLPYPNPLYAGDADTDFDGDGLPLSDEQALWKYTHQVTRTDARTLTPLSYSDGEQFSRSTRVNGRRQPTLAPDGYDKHADFVSWTASAGYRTVVLHDYTDWSALTDGAWVSRDLFDINRNGTVADSELNYFDLEPAGRAGHGWLSDNERDEDADGLSNMDELRSRMTAAYWASCYSNEKPYYVPYAGTSMADADTDGDGIRDGADDQDHDDIPNLMELSRYAASIDPDDPDGLGYWDASSTCKPDPTVVASIGDSKRNHPTRYGRVNPFNPCLPDRDSRTCALYFDATTGAPFDDSINWLSLQ